MSVSLPLCPQAHCPQAHCPQLVSKLGIERAVSLIILSVLVWGAGAKKSLLLEGIC